VSFAAVTLCVASLSMSVYCCLFRYRLSPETFRYTPHMWQAGGRGEVFTRFFGRPEGQRPLGRPSRTWEDNIKMDLREIGTAVIAQSV
jgi:hypothetical protein